jgi:hypothetical protein
MPVYTKPDGRIFCVYYDGPRRVWEPFGRGAEARQAAVKEPGDQTEKKQGPVEHPWPDLHNLQPDHKALSGGPEIRAVHLNDQLLHLRHKP